MKYQINSGYVVPDPADPHRFMLIGYNAASDSVIILRRAEMTESELPNPIKDDPCPTT